MHYGKLFISLPHPESEYISFGFLFFFFFFFQSGKKLLFLAFPVAITCDYYLQMDRLFDPDNLKDFFLLTREIN